MNKYNFTIFIFFILVFLTTSAAHAVGFGAYGTVRNDLIFHLNAGGGLVIDTNCAVDALFNDRISLGWTTSVYSPDEREKYHYGKNVTSDIGLTNTFGFGVVRMEHFRLWLGPQIGMHSHYFRYKPDLRKINNYMFTFDGIRLSPTLKTAGGGYKARLSQFGVSIGLSLGGNINFSHNITLSIEAGARFYYYYGTENTNMLVPVIVSLSYNSWVSNKKYDGYMSIAVLYHVNDSFAPVMSNGGNN